MTKPEELPSLEKLGDDIRKLHDKIAPKPKPAPAGAGVVFRVGAELMSGALVGAVAGYFLDVWLNTSPILFILCFFLGSAGGFMNVLRSLKMAGNGNNENEEGK